MEILSTLISPYHFQFLQGEKVVSLTRPDDNTNTQACIEAAQIPKGKKSEKIEVITRASIDPEDVVVVRTTDPMVVVIEKEHVRASRNLLLRAEYYDIVRHRTVLKLQQIKETKI